MITNTYMSVQLVNPKAESIRRNAALSVNITAAQGLQGILSSNLGPKGTIKMLVDGAGNIKLTKDGKVLLGEMQIQHPTAIMIARGATSQDDITGDGTTTVCLYVGQLLREANRFISEGMHSRVLVDGFELARKATLAYLEKAKIELSNEQLGSYELLSQVARTSIATKVRPELTNVLTPIVTEAVLTVYKKPSESNSDSTSQSKSGSIENPLDLHMIEIQKMQYQTASSTKLIKGLVLDHGPRHPDMPRRVENAKILILNVSLEYEKTEVNSGFYYSSAEQREKLVASERSFVDAKLKQIVDLKNQACVDGSKFVVINQKGIDPLSLEVLAKNGIMALRRAKRRNMERLQLITGGIAQNSTEELSPEVLGWAGEVYEQVIGEEKYTFVENCKNPASATILIQGPNTHTIKQIEDAVRDGIRAVGNTILDRTLVPGAGAFQIAAHHHLMTVHAHGKSRAGVQAYAEALLVVPKALAGNAGLQILETVSEIQDQYSADPSKLVGVDLDTGKPLDAAAAGVWDNYRVIRNSVAAATSIASNLLLCDEILRAGRATK